MKYFYLCGTVFSGEYKENFEKIIAAKNKTTAKKTLPQILNGFEKYKIEQIYETFSNARI